MEKVLKKHEPHLTQKRNVWQLIFCVFGLGIKNGFFLQHLMGLSNFQLGGGVEPPRGTFFAPFLLLYLLPNSD